MAKKVLSNKIRKFFPIITVIFLVIILYTVKNRKKIFAPNPYNMNYTKMKNISKSIDKGLSPKDEKTFMIVFGSRSCGACTAHYKVLQEYNKVKEKSFKLGYVPNYITDTDLEMEEAIEVVMDYIQDSSYRNWTDPKLKEYKNAATPTTFFIQDGKLQDIIVGAAKNKEEVISYVKEKVH